MPTTNGTPAQHAFSVYAQATGQTVANRTAIVSVQTPLPVKTPLGARSAIEAGSRSPGGSRGRKLAKDVADLAPGQTDQARSMKSAGSLNEHANGVRPAQNQELRELVREEVKLQIEKAKQVGQRNEHSACCADAFRAYHNFSKD